jgi:hypothetical protein
MVKEYLAKMGPEISRILIYKILQFVRCSIQLPLYVIKCFIYTRKI